MSDTNSNYELTEPGEELLDLRDIASRLQEILIQYENGDEITAEDAEYVKLATQLRDDLIGKGGDDVATDLAYHGDNYDPTLILDSYFETYAQELAYDTGAIGRDRGEWPLSCIDWERAANELKYDYLEGTFGGEKYWWRAS